MEKCNACVLKNVSLSFSTILKCYYCCSKCIIIFRFEYTDITCNQREAITFKDKFIENLNNHIIKHTEFHCL